MVLFIVFYANPTRSINVNHGAKIQWLLSLVTYFLHRAKCTNPPSCSNLFVCCELQVDLICYHCLGSVGAFAIISCIAKLLPLLAQCYSFWYWLLFNSVHLCCLQEEQQWHLPRVAGHTNHDHLVYTSQWIQNNYIHSGAYADLHECTKYDWLWRLCPRRSRSIRPPSSGYHPLYW